MQFQIRNSRARVLAVCVLMAFSAEANHTSAQDEEQSWRAPSPPAQRVQTPPRNCEVLDTRTQATIANINQQWGWRPSPCTQARKDLKICHERKRFVNQCLPEDRGEQEKADQCRRDAEARIQSACDPDARRRAPWLGD